MRYEPEQIDFFSILKLNVNWKDGGTYEQAETTNSTKEVLGKEEEKA